MHQVVQALLFLWRLSRLADLAQRIYEFLQNCWPEDWLDHFGG